MASRQYVKHVVQGSAARRGDDTDSTRQLRHRLFSGGIKQTFLCQFVLELLESQLQGSSTHRLQKFGGELQFAALVVDGDPSAGDDLHAIVRLEAQQPCLHAEHHNAQESVAIFERKVKMAGFGGAKVGNLAFHPDICVAALHRGAHGADQISHAPDSTRWRLRESEIELVAERHQWRLLPINQKIKERMTLK